MIALLRLKLILSRQYWLYKDDQVKVAIITNRDYFLKEINTLILLYHLSEQDRLQIINLYPEYNLSLFNIPFSTNAITLTVVKLQNCAESNKISPQLCTTTPSTTPQ